MFGGEAPMLLSRADLRQHLYVVGKTGTGKSTLLFNLLAGLIESGAGVGLIDPHGDLAEALLDHIPRHRVPDVIYFNPDPDYPIGFNLLQPVPSHLRHLVASSVVGAFKGAWRESWGPRLEYCLNACLMALLECPNATLLGVQRMLTDAGYREWVVKQVTDDSVRTFWLGEYASWDKRFAAEVVSPIQNKVGQLLMGPTRLMLGQFRSRFAPQFTMDHRRIFIANLSKGTLGEDKANLLGAMLISQFQTAAMQRANVPESQRVDFTLFVDEVHNFATDSFTSILSEMRKYNLGLVLSNQFLDQLRPGIRDAVFGNVGSMISFRVGESDAAVLSREFGSGFDPRLFSNLGNGEVCAKLMEGGRQYDPFLARTHPPQARRYGRREQIIRHSRERYATPRATVQDKLRRWMQNNP